MGSLVTHAGKLKFRVECGSVSPKHQEKAVQNRWFVISAALHQLAWGDEFRCPNPEWQRQVSQGTQCADVTHPGEAIGSSRENSDSAQ